MSIFRNLKIPAAYFLAALLGNNPAPERFNYALACLPAIGPLSYYPQPSRRPSGVAAAKRAARKARRRCRSGR